MSDGTFVSIPDAHVTIEWTDSDGREWSVEVDVPDTFVKTERDYSDIQIISDEVVLERTPLKTHIDMRGIDGYSWIVREGHLPIDKRLGESARERF